MALDHDPTRLGKLFDLFTFLEGESNAWGMFQDRGGAVKKAFELKTSGRWQDDTFILSEAFNYDDGSTETREWTFRPIWSDQIAATPISDAHTSMPANWVGTCADCVGEASLTLKPDCAEMIYTFRLKLSARTIDLRFHDRFFPIAETGVMNRTRVTKFGISVGEVTAFFGAARPVAAAIHELKPVERLRA